jgi:hypothetical protein
MVRRYFMLLAAFLMEPEPAPGSILLGQETTEE